MDIILLEPEKAGNVGAAARVMKNFGFENLVLTNPKCNHLSQEAKNRAKHALNILQTAKIIKKSELRKYHTLIATTAQLGTDYNITRSPITPEQLSETVINKKNVGILFGREGSGLSNKEIQMCDFVVTIPTSKKYPTMNLSHSIAIICYELFKNKENITSHIRFATDADKKQLMKMIAQRLDKMKFSTKSKKETQRKIWKRMIAKSFLTKREAFAMMGFFRKIPQFASSQRNFSK
ncbi:RNA methyltransferase [Candidatus Woesearchaeota archaeon]|nr:RNA methyltransferase [Candidatus Woesearchaeota archaeon]